MTLQRRGRLERGRPLERRRPIAGHRRPELDVPREVLEVLRIRSRGRCEAALNEAGCAQDATDPHHRKRRRDGGHAITNLVDLCRPCHSWAHAHPAKARELGLIVSAYEDPATVPVLVLSRLAGARVPCHLADDGTYVVDVANLTPALEEPQR